MTPITPITLEKLRQQITNPQNIVLLNAASCSPTPATVQAEAARWALRLAQDPMHTIWEAGLAAIAQARRELAALIGAKAGDVVLTPNATYAAMTIANSLDLRGKTVLLTSQEFHHYSALWRQLAAERDMTLKTLRLPFADEEPRISKSDLVTMFDHAMGNGIDLIFLSHVTSPTGLRLPVEEVGSIAQERGIVSFVDGAHGPGQVPIDLDHSAIDFYFGNGQKWLMAPPSVGFFWCHQRWHSHIKPLIPSEGGVYPPEQAEEPTPFGCSNWQWSHESHGTRSRVPEMVLPTAIAWQRELQAADAPAYCATLREKAITSVFEPLGLPTASFSDPDLTSWMVAAHVPPLDYWEIWRSLRAKGFDIAFPLLADGKAVLRLSAAWFIREDELEAFGKAAAQLDWSAKSSY